jgi:hypothetical protein
MVAVDTGSSNLIVNSPESAWCGSGNCDTYRSYNAGSSTSAKLVDNNMNTRYEVTSLIGSWVLDDVEFGGKTISQLYIGSANNFSNSTENLWGFGYSGGATVLGLPSNETTLQSIAKAGLTKSASMSIYLNQTGSPTGSLLFGGVDTSLYTGGLHTLPIVPNNGTYDRLAVDLQSVSVIDAPSNLTVTTGLPVRVMLDTGNFDIKVPTQVAQSVRSVFNITANYNVGGFDFSLCPCSLAKSSARVSFDFGPVNITVPMTSLVTSPPASILEGLGVNPSVIPNGTCLFLVNSFPSEVVAAGELVYILGGAFISNAYFVFDQDAQEVALAQANFNPGASNILEISAGRNGLANVTSTASSTNTASRTSVASSAPASTTSTSAAMEAWQIPTLWNFAIATIVGFILSF